MQAFCAREARVLEQLVNDPSARTPLEDAERQANIAKAVSVIFQHREPEAHELEQPEVLEAESGVTVVAPMRGAAKDAQPQDDARVPKSTTFVSAGFSGAGSNDGIDEPQIFQPRQKTESILTSATERTGREQAGNVQRGGNEGTHGDGGMMARNGISLEEGVAVTASVRELHGTLKGLPVRQKRVVAGESPLIRSPVHANEGADEGGSPVKARKKRLATDGEHVVHKKKRVEEKHTSSAGSKPTSQHTTGGVDVSAVVLKLLQSSRCGAHIEPRPDAFVAWTNHIAHCDAQEQQEQRHSE
jgi:hypothetical protein